MSTELKQPSGKDYGRVLRYGWVDDRDFTLSLSVKDGQYSWVVEYKDGTQVLIDNHKPFHEPIFGVDEGDWFEWVESTYNRIDDWLAANAQAQGEV